MTICAETERLMLRPLLKEDAAFILEMDSDPEVLRFLSGKTISTLAEAEGVIAYIRQQYQDNGIGRWAVIRKEDKAFLGWCGIKLVNDAVTNGQTNYYDIGYRFLPRYWGKGYAFEAAKACFDYAFATLRLEELHATVMTGNTASRRIAEKLGLLPQRFFIEEQQEWIWYSVSAPLKPVVTAS